MSDDREYPAAAFQWLIGKTLARVEDVKSDEGLRLVFTDGTVLEIAFTGGEGDIEASEP